MRSLPELSRLITTLARIDDAGLLEEFQLDVAEANRGPASDLHRWPHYGFCVDRFARVASRVFGVPICQCREAAREALLPSTRRGVALEILEEYEQRLAQDALSRTAKARLATDRRRRRRG